MNAIAQRKMDIIEAIASGDPEYRRLQEAAKAGEQALLAQEKKIPVEMQDIMWAYLDTCTELGKRRLEVACMYMEFPYGSSR